MTCRPVPRSEPPQVLMNPTDPSPRRNPWPFAVAGFFGLFGLWVATSVILCASHQSDLVIKDYYAEELRYQDQIDRRARAQGLDHPLNVAYDAGQRTITIALPAEHAASRPAGRVQLYRPSAASLDWQFELDVDPAGRQTLAAQHLANGLWRVRVTWSVGGQEYYRDERLVVGTRSVSVSPAGH